MPINSDEANGNSKGGRFVQATRLWLRALMDFIYPPICLLCEKPLLTDERLVCVNCWKQLPLVIPQDLPANCLSPEFCFEFSLAAFEYQPSVQRLIHSFKYRGMRCLAQPLAEKMMRVCTPALERWGAQGLVPVPLHPARKRERGYDQADLLAWQLGARLNLPVYPLLRRTRYTPPQAQQSRIQRRENMIGAFKLAKDQIVGDKRLVLVDDVLTTGNTVDACARILRQAGVRHIASLTIARAQ